MGSPNSAILLLFLILKHLKYTPNSWSLLNVYFVNSLLLRLLQQYSSNKECFPIRNQLPLDLYIKGQKLCTALARAVLSQ